MLDKEPLLPVVAQWLAKIQAAVDFKRKRFQLDADEGMKFFCGPYEFLYGAEHRRTDRHFKQEFDDHDDGEIPNPKFQMTVNKTAELVQLFGPVLYHRNPIRQVNPREQPLPGNDLLQIVGQDPSATMMLQQLLMQGQQGRAIDRVRAKLMEYYLNYTPNALNLKQESRYAIDEAIIKGAGCLWVEVYTPPTGSPKMVGSFYDTVDNLFIDPDFKTREAAKWICRKHTEPVWEVERKFKLPPGTLKAQMESSSAVASAEVHPDGAYNRAKGETNDLIVYYEIYSKTGIGGRLTGMDPSLGQQLDMFGDYCYIVVTNGCNYPLNVPDELWDLPEQQATQAIMQAVQWPTPFWADGEWPVEVIAFHDIPGDPWPMSHLAPGMGELKFLNWAYSYVAGKIRVSSRDFIAILEEADPALRDAILHGADYEVIKVKGSAGKTIDQLVSFLKHPPFQMDIWKVIEAVSEQFDKRVGLSELIYGMTSRQDRSATESATKREQMNVRPDEMANKVEDCMSNIARKEAFAIRFHLQSADVQTIMGSTGAFLWDKFIVASNPSELLYSLEYRIEAGSARKPNRDRDAQNAKDVMGQLLPFFENVALSAGITAPFNAAVTMWCKANDMKSDGLTLDSSTTPPPQPAPGPGAPAPNPNPQAPR